MLVRTLYPTLGTWDGPGWVIGADPRAGSPGCRRPVAAEDGRGPRRRMPALYPCAAGN
ncbi:hypothetical protein [Methylobacterium nodulans]|nr:hypothetical protein [Methylobacterium nodulans]